MNLPIQENVPLAPLTTLGVGGPARYFVRAEDETTVREALVFARDQRLPVFILGGGSNLVVADEGYSGVVIHVAIEGREAAPEFCRDPEEKAYRVGAGEAWDHFVEFSVGQNLAGIECLSGIPGSVGGTPVQNVGAYGQEVSCVIRSVRVYDCVEDRIRDLDHAACGFSYRRSLFNTTARDRFIVLSVNFVLRKEGAPTLRYADLERYFQKSPFKPSLRDVREAVRSIRRRKAMLLVSNDPDCRSVGSFFKNPVVSEMQYQDLTIQFSGVPVPHYAVTDASAEARGGAARVKLAAAWLIEQAGFSKGYPSAAVRASRVGLSTKHTLALVNRGGATAREILALMQEIQRGVFDRFGIQLQPEPVFVGFDPERLAPREAS